MWNRNNYLDEFNDILQSNPRTILIKESNSITDSIEILVKKATKKDQFGPVKIKYLRSIPG